MFERNKTYRIVAEPIRFQTRKYHKMKKQKGTGP